MHSSIVSRLLLLGVVFAHVHAQGAEPAIRFQTNDVVAFVGGADVVAAQATGHLESLLAIANAGKGIRFRNFAWEGDTVFEQPRDYGFPSLLTNLQKASVTVVIVQFGRAEGLGARTAAEFRDAYDKLLQTFAPRFRKLILVTPVPLENGRDFQPALSKRNAVLADYSTLIRGLARERDCALIDLFDALTKDSAMRLTSDGLQLTESGHAEVAALFVRAVAPNVVAAGGGFGKQAKWKNGAFEEVRQAVIAKNRLWFDYSRPQNWAFLGGDRVAQPSSRDHRNPTIRWFPTEMEKFLPLIAEAEEKIERAAIRAAKEIP